jgi:F-type H+-transporting ATPase subunit epsilon
MKLKVLLPTSILIEQDVEKVIAEAENGSFCLLPGHIDFVAFIVPGILTFEDSDGSEQFVAVDEGVLVKCGDDVFVSVTDAIAGEELERLTEAVSEKFMTVEEERKKAETVLAKMEANFINNFLQLNKYD